MNLLQNSNRIAGIAGLGLLAGLSLSTLQACDLIGDGEGAGIPGCDLSCPAEGIAEGNAALTGIASVDAFFGAVIDVNAAANNISSSLRAELDAIALSLDLEPGASGVEIRDALQLKLDTALEAGLTITYAPPRCEASVDVAVSAAAECDAMVDPGSATVECQGACEIEGGVAASCEADAELVCTGTAPEFMCNGTCEGSCELTTAAQCDGTCRGTCTGTCSVRDAQDNCAGECVGGTCQGTCELSAGGTCNGMCTGTCTYKPGAAGCEADASARCEAMAEGSVQCDGRCEGEVTPPMVSAECEATVDAKANASVECTPPSLELTWQWSAAYSQDATAQAEFKAWLQGFKGHISVMLAAKAKADILIESLEELRGAGVDALQGASDIVSSADIVGTFKLANCGLPELETAANLVADAAGGLQAEASASLDVFAAVGI